MKTTYANVESLLDQSFDGAMGPLVHFLLEEQKLNDNQKKELIEALKRIESRIPELGEQTNYSEVLVQISDAVLNDRYGEKLDKIIETISALEFPAMNLPLTKDGKLKVEGDPKWIGGGGLDKYSLDTYGNRVNPATED